MTIKTTIAPRGGIAADQDIEITKDPTTKEIVAAVIDLIDTQKNGITLHQVTVDTVILLITEVVIVQDTTSDFNLI